MADKGPGDGDEDEKETSSEDPSEDSPLPDEQPSDAQPGQSDRQTAENDPSAPVDSPRTQEHSSHWQSESSAPSTHSRDGPDFWPGGPPAEDAGRPQQPPADQPPPSAHPPSPPPQEPPPAESPQQPPPPGPPPTSPRQRAGEPLPQQGRYPSSHGYEYHPPSGAHPDQQSPTDPVKETYAGRIDLYDIATWEERTPLDSLAVNVTNGLRASRTVLLIAVAAALFFGQILVAGVLILEEPLLAVLAILSVLPALVLAGYFWYGDPTAREPLTLLAATFLLSMLFASFAAVINSTFIPGFEAFGLFGLTVFFFVIVGPIEEFVKWLAIRVYAYQSETFQTIADGAVYGAVAGLGFAAIENLIYIVSVYMEMAPAGGDIQSQLAASVATQRAFVGPGHVIFSAWAGFYLGLAKFNPANRGPIVVKGLLIAAAIHALYNTLVTVLPELLPLTVGGLFTVIVLYHGFWFAVLYRKISKYRTLYRQIGQHPSYR